MTEIVVGSGKRSNAIYQETRPKRINTLKAEWRSECAFKVLQNILDAS